MAGRRMTETVDDPRPDWDTRGRCECGERRDTCNANLCQTCFRNGYPCLDTCGCRVRGCKSIFTVLNRIVGDNALDLRADACFVGHLKHEKIFTIEDLTRRLLGDLDRSRAIPIPEFAIFRPGSNDTFLVQWRTNWFGSMALTTQAATTRQNLAKQLIIYGLMECTTATGPRVHRYSLCRERWVICAEVLHCWDCAAPKPGCYDRGRCDHWHCACKPGNWRKRIEINEQCKLPQCKGFSKRQARNLQMRWNSDGEEVDSDGEPLGPRGEKRSSVASPEKKDEVKRAKAGTFAGSVNEQRSLLGFSPYHGPPVFEEEGSDDEIIEELRPRPIRRRISFPPQRTQHQGRGQPYRPLQGVKFQQLHESQIQSTKVRSYAPERRTEHQRRQQQPQIQEDDNEEEERLPIAPYARLPVSQPVGGMVRQFQEPQIQTRQFSAHRNQAQPPRPQVHRPAPAQDTTRRLGTQFPRPPTHNPARRPEAQLPRVPTQRPSRHLIDQLQPRTPQNQSRSVEPPSPSPSSRPIPRSSNRDLGPGFPADDKDLYDASDDEKNNDEEEKDEEDAEGEDDPEYEHRQPLPT